MVSWNPMNNCHPSTHHPCIMVGYSRCWFTYDWPYDLAQCSSLRASRIWIQGNPKVRILICTKGLGNGVRT